MLSSNEIMENATEGMPEEQVEEVSGVFARNAYSFMEEPWHRLGTVSNKPKSAEDIMNEDFGGGFPVVTRADTVPLNTQNDDGSFSIKPTESGFYSIIRGATPSHPEEIVFDTCTERYTPLQPIEVARKFDESVQQFVETMGLLRKGKELFITWSLPLIEVVPNDIVKMYGVVRTGFDTKTGARLFTTTYRVWCSNTLTMAENWAKSNTNKSRNQGAIWRGKGVNRNLLRDLGYWLEHVQGNALAEVANIREFFTRCADVPVNDEDARKLLEMAYPDKPDNSKHFPTKLQDDRKTKIQLENESTARMREGALMLFKGAGTKITPDAWGLLNSVTEWLSHGMKSKKPIAESLVFGGRQATAMKMVKVLTDYVK